MRVYGLTDIGKVRDTNQDSFVVSPDESDVVWAVVCDGMGGVNGGLFASSIAAESYSHCFETDFKTLKSKQIENLLKDAVCTANGEVYKKALQQKELLGMGTTLVSAAVVGNNAYFVNVGDSRAYHITSDSATQITTDHSVVQKLIESGKITRQEAKNHPEKNMITRAVGVKEEIEADFKNIKLSAGDGILLCTDGLSNYVEEDEIFDIVSKDSIEAAAQNLVSLALSRGGTDNITVVIIK